MPVVSIITPVYNAAAFLPITIKSVQQQTFMDWEWMIVIDHKSTDTSLEIAKMVAAQDPRIIVLTSPDCANVSANRNHALDRAKGQYVAFVDADDIWLSDKLKRQLDFIRSKHAVFTFHSYEKISFSGNKTGRAVRAPSKVTYHKLLADNSIGCSTVMIDRNWLGKRRFENAKHEDFRLWLDLLRDGKTTAYGLSDILSNYRLVQDSLSSNKTKSAGWRWEILTKREKLPPLFATYYFGNYAIRAVWKRVFGRA